MLYLLRNSFRSGAFSAVFPKSKRGETSWQGSPSSCTKARPFQKYLLAFSGLFRSSCFMYLVCASAPALRSSTRYCCWERRALSCSVSVLRVRVSSA